MKSIRFFITQSMLLGVCAFAIWALLGARGIWPFSISLDTFAATAAGVVLTAMFLLLVAWPIQFVLRANRSLAIRLLAGAISGPIGVWLGLLVFSNYPVDWNSYVLRALELHVIYIGVGVAFAAACQRRQRSSPLLQRTAMPPAER